MRPDRIGCVDVCRTACLIAILTLWVAPGAAHQRQLLQIGSADYLVVIGFINEPVYTGDKSGVDLVLLLPDPAYPTDSHAPGVKPVENLDQTLKVEVKAGPHGKMFELKPAYRAPGRYQAFFYPTVATTYSFRLFGTLANVPIDLSFMCNPLGHVAVEDNSRLQLSEHVARKALIGSFGCPTARTDAEFPPASR
jgi:hypothetical protein